MTSSNNCLPFPFGSRVFLPKAARASSHAYFPAFPLVLSRLLGCLSTQRCKTIPAQRHVTLQELKPIISHHSLSPGSPFSLPRIAVERAVPVPDLLSHHLVRKALRGIYRSRSCPQVYLPSFNGRWTRPPRKRSKQEGRSTQVLTHL